MNSVVIILPTRLNSVRLPRKPMQTLVGKQRLIDSALHKLKLITAYCPNVLTSFREPELQTLGLDHGLDNIDQNPTGHFGSLTEPWRSLNYDRIVTLNLVCMPFVSLGTIRQIIEIAQNDSDDWPRLHCKEEKTIAWDGYKQPLVMMPGPLDTKLAPTILLPSNIGDIFTPRDCGLSTGRMCSPRPMVTSGLDPIELIDIDTAADLALAQRIAGCCKP